MVRDATEAFWRTEQRPAELVERAEGVDHILSGKALLLRKRAETSQ